jgi:hypothetical protein
LLISDCRLKNPLAVVRHRKLRRWPFNQQSAIKNAFPYRAATAG